MGRSNKILLFELLFLILITIVEAREDQMNIVFRNIVVVVVGLLCIYFGPWWLVEPILPFFLLLFLGFAWANVHIWPPIQSRTGRTVAVILFSAVCTGGAFWPFMMALSERSENAMWEGIFEQMDQQFPYEVTDLDGTTHRTSGTNGVDLSTNTVRGITNSTLETIQKTNEAPTTGGTVRR